MSQELIDALTKHTEAMNELTFAIGELVNIIAADYQGDATDGDVPREL